MGKKKRGRQKYKNLNILKKSVKSFIIKDFFALITSLFVSRFVEAINANSNMISNINLNYDANKSFFFFLLFVIVWSVAVLVTLESLSMISIIPF